MYEEYLLTLHVLRLYMAQGASQLPCAPNLVASPSTRVPTTKALSVSAPDLSNSVFYRGFDKVDAATGSPIGTTHYPLWIDFNASYCNAIYGRENTIKPLSRSCKFAIRYI